MTNDERPCRIFHMKTNENHSSIRIRKETHQRLKIMAAEMGRSIVSLIEEWVADAENQHKRAVKRTPKKSVPQTPDPDAE